MRRFGIFFLGLLFATQSCVREESFDDTPEGNLEALWQIIDQRYCFLDYKAETIGLDWDAVHTNYRRRLNPSMTRLQLFEVLCDMLSELRDGHVNLYCSADVGRYWSWKDTMPANLDHELREAYLGTDYHIAAGLRYRILDDIRQSLVNQIKVHDISRSFLIGVVRHFRLLKKDEREKGGYQQ